MRRLSAGLALCCLVTVSASAASPEGMQATFVDANGKNVGDATLAQTPHGVLITARISGLPPGEHGFHLHETGRCDAAGGFESAGGHYAPRGKAHGFKAEDGPHAGDMPNQFVGSDGWLRAHVLNARVSIGGGAAALLDADGSALVVHAGADDYGSQPSGKAGKRLACAVIRRS
ncbi:superoxide dismutase [Cu-Zn] [Allostella vacuolata]|nr:superoxide dismutase [Cu-Zn] [Stella vacuolata]